jgi:hypothetical protein
MASFTDAISQFNPYVAQLPVEAMAKVGMQKQAQYEQGVQKIQSYIDNIAGMDVANDADKAYLQSKMNQLGNNLKVVAGGDFSNQQLVNSVGGMATQIIKDPNIQNAVASTAWYKKQRQQLDSDYQAGKSSIANVSDFEKQASAWLSSDKVGQTFRGKYSPYIDVQKKFQEVIKAVNPSASSDDYAYTQFIDKDGTIKTGDLAAAMTRVTKEGVSRETIENAIRASLTPDDVNQMRIDANYRFKDISDPNQFKTAIVSGYDSQVKQLDYQKSMLQGIINSSGNDADRLKAQTSIASIDATKQKLKNTLEGRLSLANENLEAAKLDLYKDESIFQTANAFSWEKKATQLMNNPALQAQFEQKRINISERSLAQQITMDNWSMQQDLIKNQQWEKDYDISVKKLYGEGSGFTSYLGKVTENLAMPSTAIENKIGTLKSSEVSSISKLASAMNIKPEEVETKLEEYKKDPSAINARYQGLANIILNNRLDQQTLDNQLKTAESNVLQNDPNLKIRKEELDYAIEKNRPLTVTSNGKKEVYSPKELFDLASKIQNINLGKAGRVNKPAGTPLTLQDIEESAISSKLTDKENRLYNIINKNKNNKNNTDVDIHLRQQMSIYNTLVSRDKTLSKELNTKVNNYLSTTSGDFVPAASAIFTPSPESKDFYANVANVAASKYSMENLGIKGGSATMSQDDAKKVKEWTSSKEKDNLTFKKLNYAGETHLVVSKDGEEIMIPLDAQQSGALPKLSGESNKFDEEIHKIQRGNGSSLSTNPTGKIEDAYYQKWKMPNVKNTVVFADLNADQATPSLQYLDINIKGKDGKMYPMTIDTPMNASDADMWIRSMTDSKWKELYLTNPYWKNQINNIF